MKLTLGWDKIRSGNSLPDLLDQISVTGPVWLAQQPSRVSSLTRLHTLPLLPDHQEEHSDVIRQRRWSNLDISTSQSRSMTDISSCFFPPNILYSFISRDLVSWSLDYSSLMHAEVLILYSGTSLIRSLSVAGTSLYWLPCWVPTYMFIDLQGNNVGPSVTGLLRFRCIYQAQVSSCDCIIATSAYTCMHTSILASSACSCFTSRVFVFVVFCYLSHMLTFLI